jgi:AAA+ superfamily predicted ATPase
MTADINDLFDEILDLPDPVAQRRYEALVGLDDVKERIHKQARILLKPSLLSRWADKNHQGSIALIDVVRDRPPLFIFGGDVGTGKTTLAETFGDRIARTERLSGGVQLMRLSLNARGSGTVGEMTTLITGAFRAVEEQAPIVESGDATQATVLLIDEGDALAQSRDADQMHHEDRAGVNALIRGIDTISTQRRPVITVLSTNRLDALDPAVRRRAFGEFTFTRPDESMRATVLAQLFQGVGFDQRQINKLAHITGENGRGYGFTYSDLTTRLASTVLLNAFDQKPVIFDDVVTAVQRMPPTPPFGARGPS